MEKPSLKKSIVGRIFQFDKIATIIGFTVDCITIVSILFAIKLDGSINIQFSKFISSELALGIWIIAAYTYFAFLHKYWDKNLVDKDHKETFGSFIAKDLIRHFRNPALLFPMVVLLIILIAIIASSEMLFLNIIASIVLLVMFIGLFILVIGDDMSEDVSLDKRSKKIIDDNWDYLKKRISIELSQEQWINILYLTDVAELLDIDVQVISYAFAKYAFENPGKVKYGTVCRYSDGEDVTGREYVLVNMKSLDSEKYYFLP